MRSASSPHAEPLYRSFGYGWENMHDALDGIAIDIPALKVKATHGEAFPLNIQVKDPTWPMRDLIDVSVSVKPGEARTVWLDTRDRILPNKSFYLTIAGAGSGLRRRSARGSAKIRLVSQGRCAAGLEGAYRGPAEPGEGQLGLSGRGAPGVPARIPLYARVVTDATDLLKVDPDNRIAREYWADINYNSQGPLPFTQVAPPAGVPLWAFRQLEDLKLVHHFVDWWIDNRQAGFGDLGGGISDDTPTSWNSGRALALMGVEPDKIRTSHTALADAAYKDHMFTDGLATIATDELHSYEDGHRFQPRRGHVHRQGDPKVVERLMTTSAALNRIIQTNPAGHLHFQDQRVLRLLLAEQRRPLGVAERTSRCWSCT